MSKLTCFENAAFGIDLPEGARVTQYAFDVLVSVGKSMLVTEIDPDPAIWSSSVTQWEASLAKNPDETLSVAFNRSLTTPYLGREQLIEAKTFAIGFRQYHAKVAFVDPDRYRRAILKVHGPGENSDYQETWSRSLATFRFLGEARTAESVLVQPKPPLIIDEVVQDAAVALASHLQREAKSEVWFRAAVRGIRMVNSLAIKVAVSAEGSYPATRYTLCKFMGKVSPAEVDPNRCTTSGFG